MGAVELHSSLLQSAINANILICDFIQIARSPCLEEGGGGGMSYCLGSLKFALCFYNQSQTSTILYSIATCKELLTIQFCIHGMMGYLVPPFPVQVG